jgi:hypothetical protein
MLKYALKLQDTRAINEGKGKAGLGAWINLFNFGLYMLVFLLAAIVVFAVIWAKYCK